MENYLNEYFPDGTPIDPWFYDAQIPKLENLGKQYDITKFGVCDDGNVHTQEIQNIIDHAALNGGGVIVVPAGTYITGALFFKQGVNLYVSKNGILKGSDDISDYPLCHTRIEGECCQYFPALINADNINGFVACGEGTIDGNGHRAWRAFWKRRQWNPACTNKDEQRPRLVYLSKCTNAIIAQLHLCNSHFWTNHLYKCDHVKFLNCHIFAPQAPTPAPSSDAIDIDVCTDILIKNCYMEVHDDAVVLKGGKGPWADQSEDNGSNERIIVEDCEYGFCISGFTCGSESIHNRNVIVRRIKVEKILQLIHLKMRPDTPQHYEYIRVENIQGSIIGSFININPWTQFFDLKGRKDKPISKAENITIQNCDCSCKTFFNVTRSDTQYKLSDFHFENISIKTQDRGSNLDVVDNITAVNLEIIDI